MNYVTVQFKDGNSYNRTSHYTFLNSISGIMMNDKVVCDTANGLLIGTVSNVSAINESKMKITRWIVSKIDLTAHIERLEREKKLKELKTKMDAEIKKVNDLQLYEYYASFNHNIYVMLNEYNKLKGGM